MAIYSQIVAICWLAFFASWAILAAVLGGGSGRKPRVVTGLVIRLLIAAALVLGAIYANRSSTQVFDVDTGDLAAAGAVVCVVGLAFAIWARVTLGANWGMPRTLHENPELVTSGPYRYVRHPIYTGMAAMFIGTTLVEPYAAIPAVLVILYSVFSALREEKDMQRQFPDAYREYRKRSKFLVPFLI